MTASKDAPRPLGGPRVVPAASALVVEGIGVVGATEHGEHVGLELAIEGGGRTTVLFPVILFQKLMAGLMAAGGAAQAAQVARLGSRQAALDHVGAQPFAPDDWGFGRARTRDGVEVLVMRLIKGGTPVFDVALPMPDAAAFADQLQSELSKGPPAARPMQ